MANETETIEIMTTTRIDSVIRDLRLTLEACEKLTDPKCISERQQAYLSKLHMCITAMEAIKERPL